MKNAINLGLTPGREDGVGPELLLKAINLHNPRDYINYIWCADGTSLKRAASFAHLSIDFISDSSAMLEKKIPLSFLPQIKESCLIKRQGIFLEKAVSLAKDKKIDALVTGPIEKAALTHLDQGQYPGQTEYFSNHLGTDKKPMMTFMGGSFILSLLTTHVPLKDVSARISKDLLKEHINRLVHYCRFILGQKILTLGILGLNPHAGELGLLGHEEEEIIKPAIKEIKDPDLKIFGPLPADGYFAYFHQAKPFDILVAMYHDQGLIPYKLLAKGRAVNVTLGLTIPRVSPAHGTAIEIAGKNIACPLSTEKALELAIKLAKIDPLFAKNQTSLSTTINIW